MHIPNTCWAYWQEPTICQLYATLYWNHDLEPQGIQNTECKRLLNYNDKNIG